MNNPTFRFTFKPAQEPQRELIHGWLKQDYIARWIHGVGLQSTLTGLEKFFAYTAEGKSLDRQMTITQHWVGYDGNRPIVYLLSSNVFKSEDSEYAKYSLTDGPMITLDIFLGDPEYLGKGLATRLIKDFLLGQCSDVTEVFIDPEQSNERATHVYEKVGFKKVGEFIASWHPVPHHTMRLNMKDLKLREVLQNLTDEINAEYGFHDGIPRINYGPCGVFAKLFYEEWNSLFPEKVNICFILTPNKDECDHVAIRLPAGEIFDGGIGIHTDSEYSEKFIVEDMFDYDEALLEKWSYGLDREYPRFCPDFNRDAMRKIIRSNLRTIL